MRSGLRNRSVNGRGLGAGGPPVLASSPVSSASWRRRSRIASRSSWWAAISPTSCSIADLGRRLGDLEQDSLGGDVGMPTGLADVDREARGASNGLGDRDARPADRRRRPGRGCSRTWSIRVWKPSASSNGLRSCRCRFSTRAISSACSSLTVSSMQGTSVRPTCMAAWNRRSPETSW